jgi:hypothetical protein
MIDENLKHSIFESVKKHGQTDGLAEKIIAWIEKLIEHGADRKNDLVRIETLYDATASQDWKNILEAIDFESENDD